MLKNSLRFIFVVKTRILSYNKLLLIYDKTILTLKMTFVI